MSEFLITLLLSHKQDRRAWRIAGQLAISGLMKEAPERTGTAGIVT
jgi:hypothetical protein